MPGSRFNTFLVMFRHIRAVFCKVVVDRVQYRSVKIRFELTSYNITKTHQSIEV